MEKEMEREKLLHEIMAHEFSAIDLRLFLNTHPEDKQALAHFNHIGMELKRLKEEFESIYGPLSYTSPSDENYFSWIDNPWPWEKTYLKGEK